jgi:outer membrane protein assembly factor BamA
MLIHIKKSLIFILIVFQNIFSQAIKDIEVSGNVYFDRGSIVEWSGLKTGEVYRPGRLDSALVNIARNFAQQGYFYSTFNHSYAQYSVDSSNVTIYLQVQEGPPSLIRKIIIDNPDTTDVTSISSFSFLEGQVFDKYEIEANINSWLRYLENTGYPFARAVVRSVELSEEKEKNPYVDVTIFVEKGIHSTIDRIVINGNTSTDPEVITRELRLDRNQVYSQQQIDEFPKRLNRLRFFEPVQRPEFFINQDNEGVLVINVKEKQTNNFDGIIGYIPPSGNIQKGYLTGLVNVSLRNLFGTGRAAAVRWQQYDRFSQELELRYLEPWILSYPFNVSGGFFQRKQDTTYVQRRVEGTLEFLATEDISAGVTLNSEQVIPSFNLTPRFTVYNSTSFTTGLNLKIDTRDDPYAPVEGFLFLNSYSFSRKRIYGPVQFITANTRTSLNLQRISVDFSFFYQLFSRQIIATGLHGRELRGPAFENSDLFRLGGNNTLRGYRESQYLGSRIFWSNLEYRFLLTRRTYVFLFTDNGYYLRKEEPDRNILKMESFKSGYGAGINLETGLGVLAVSYAIAAGDNFSNGKIHFGIVNEF